MVNTAPCSTSHQTERKRKKAGAADSHTKVAEKLLAAHMRREAITHVQKGKGNDTGCVFFFGL